MVSEIPSLPKGYCLTFRADNGADALGKVHEILQRGARLDPDGYQLVRMVSQLTGPVDDVPLKHANPDVRRKPRPTDATMEIFEPAEVERQRRESKAALQRQEQGSWRR